jgi:hypothetical protein
MFEQITIVNHDANDVSLNLSKLSKLLTLVNISKQYFRFHSPNSSIVSSACSAPRASPTSYYWYSIFVAIKLFSNNKVI